MNKYLLTIALSIPLISYAEVPATKGYIYTDKGSRIIAYKVNEGKGKLSKANSAGWTFANGEFWILNNQVPKILKDEYEEISFKDIQDKDILVRYDKLGNVKDTLTACQPSKKSNICDDKPHPSIYLFVLGQNNKMVHPETTKIYRYMNKKQ